MIEHLDETGQPCTRHGAISTDTLLGYAAVGSRVSGFHHDAASKLQSLMMALDELGELSADPDLQQATETAQVALRELLGLVSMNRALTKAPVRKRSPIRDLAQRAADRYGVRLRGDIPDLHVDVAPPSITHALALVFDIAAGPVQLGRTLEIAVVTAGPQATITLTGPGDAAANLPANGSEIVAIATFLFKSEEGTLRCTPRGFMVALPLAT